MSTIDTSYIKKGLCIIFRDAPHIVVEKTFVSPGKGSAFYRTKLKNIKTGSVLEFTFKSGEKLEEAPVEVKEFQYSYSDGEELFFVDPRTYEQVTLKKEIVGDFFPLMKEQDAYQLYMLDGQTIALRPPLKVRLKVVKAEPGAKGNTVTGATKEVELETGYKVLVPLFIKEGDIVSVNVESGKYTERVTE
ncbi:elongation factor P [Candidatus Shapirobacteria bacterium CG03_land_8_20_14_0_80_40_19]|uniref:Elongation factor P n=3 Tax=Candidatus Shapironibacteriota TaxID=1752721 RepID=A0A2M7BEG5_9BACT|nr:MAG: elongation factor P [Candidatus Shapirobacteria bacterium CG11_big_fil_rev_8_21_14_0_20_40_12]PIV01501.1 MAG: elongation factor P [Candidatus Shapirobacteria bacterium CG03_land_8_20_14_0_80_40_19]PJC28906.1 MAG: elongation factor P [Candidatus Shapirobacteria bacterium CG_4_9_14_0_2_um_filter_40_11]